MELYLRDYIQFMSDTNKFATISDTEQYISTNDFDVNYIVNVFDKHINLQSIFNLTDRAKFYNGHKRCDKYSLLIHFFYVLHNYAKNLMLNYDLYSTKSIQETSGNVKDCLVHIPRYRHYLAALLGYEFQPDKDEWLIPDTEAAFTAKRQQKLAAVCILCAHGHQMLTTMKENTQFDDDSSDTVSKSSNDNLNPLSSTWNCHNCTLTNSDKDSNCLACFTLRKQDPMEIPVVRAPVKKPKSNTWECTACTFSNELSNPHCEVCGEGRKLPPEQLPHVVPLKNGENSLTDTSDSVDSDHESSEDKPHLTKYMKSVSHVTKSNELPSETDIRKYKSENAVHPQHQKNWKCTKCTYINSASDSTCCVCLENRRKSQFAKSPTHNNAHLPTSAVTVTNKSEERTSQTLPKLRKPYAATDPENHDYRAQKSQTKSVDYRARASPPKSVPKRNDIEVDFTKKSPGEYGQRKKSLDRGDVIPVIPDPKPDKGSRRCLTCDKQLTAITPNKGKGWKRKSKKNDYCQGCWKEKKKRSFPRKFFCMG